MEDFLSQQLKRLKNIEPDPAFKAYSKRAILTYKHPQGFVFGLLKPTNLAWIGVFTALTVIAAISYFLIPAKPILSSALDEQSLNKELNNLTINIQLQSISYEQAINQTIASALTEITNTQTKHLNPAILNSENQSFNLPPPTDSRIDQLLEQIIF